MKNAHLISAALLFSIVIIGCGPGNSSLESEEAQRREIRNQKISELDVIVGIYPGEMIQTRDNKVTRQPFRLEIIRTQRLVMGGSGVQVQVPTLMGMFSIGEVTAAVIFPQGDYDNNDQRFTLLTTQGSEGLYSTLTGTIINGQLRAELAGGSGVWQLSATRIGR